MTEKEARATLRAQGITNPSKTLVENWLRVQQYEEAASPPPAARETVRDMQPCISPTLSLEETPSAGRPSSESNLEPILRERGQLQRQPGPRRPGRPRIIASWFPKVAEAMTDGTSLETALAMNGITNLSKSEIRACYRNKTLQAMYQEARRKFLAEHHGRRPTLRAKIGRYM